MKRIVIVVLIAAVAKGLSFLLSAFSAFLVDLVDERTPTKHNYVSALIILYYVISFLSLLISVLMWIAPVLYFISAWPKVFSVAFYIVAIGLAIFLSIAFCTDMSEHFDLYGSHFAKALIASIINWITLNWVFNFSITALDTAFELSDFVFDLCFVIPSSLVFLIFLITTIVLSVKARRAEKDLQ